MVEKQTHYFIIHPLKNLILDKPAIWFPLPLQAGKNVHKYVTFRLEQSIRLMSEKVFCRKKGREGNNKK
jgi:hypothetical protein